MHQYKILMIGDSGVGKSSLLHRYANDSFSPNFLPTIGIDYKIKLLTVEDKIGKRNFRLSLWDTAGQERFRNITKQYFRGAHGMVLVYDSTDRVSFENVNHWISQIEEADMGESSGVIVTLVANKCDQINQEVSEEEGQALADERGIRFFKTSAKQNINVSEAFLILVLDIERRHVLRRALNKLEDSESVHLTTDLPKDTSSYKDPGCCGGSVTVPS